MKPPVKAFLFDLDGTLLDTMAGLAESVNYALRTRGERTWSVDEVRSFVGNGARLLVARAAAGGESRPDFDDLLSDFRSHYAQHAAEGARPYDGIQKLISALKANGAALGVVTNKDEDVARSLVSRFFPESFSFVAGGNAGRPPKPDPASPLAALKALGAKASETLYIGDSEVDAATASAAGLPFVLCSWGFRPREALEPLGKVVDSPEALLSWCSTAIQ